MARFTVDTHLFRELGELLVGRDSTALIELIKNAYDADATSVTVEGHRVESAREGKIIISDNGNGMNPEKFESGFLRVATRIKTEGIPVSKKYKRAYTGAKGIGRLSAHKLAKHMEVYSIPDKTKLTKTQSKEAVFAKIDWDKIESVETFDEIDTTNAIIVTPEKIPSKGKPGTIIELKKLRRRWTPAERARFFGEVQSFSPPQILIKPDPKIFSSNPLIPKIQIAKSKDDPGFRVELFGDFESGDDYWQALVQNAAWMLEIDANKKHNKIYIAITPTKKTLKNFPNAKQQKFIMPHPSPKEGPYFHSRIIIREGATIGKAAERTWLGKVNGIRVYMEGFRVLPYGEPGDDWLSIDADYVRRDKQLRLLHGADFAGSAPDDQEGLLSLNNNNYYGAVFLTYSQAPTLKMVINREGFVPDSSYLTMVEILRKAISLSVRVRASAKQRERTDRSESRKQRVIDSEKTETKKELREQVEESVKKASALASQAKEKAAEGKFDQAQTLIETAAEEFNLSSETSERLLTEQSILRILSSVGLQMTSFVHEINGMLGMSNAIETSIHNITQQIKDTKIRKRLTEVNQSVGDLRRSIERQASYLTDVVSIDARRRRSKQKIFHAFEKGKKLIERNAERQNITIQNKISSEAKSPPMFPAEVTVIFSNLLTNAIKAAGKNGKIRASSRQKGSKTIVSIENTGKKINPTTSEKFFEPFRSTTTITDPTLGQGMGMGLPITRNIIEEYGGSINFVTPKLGFSTAIEIEFE